ncbi:hypothetical protein MCO_00516, partial [Bartonella sp. DB5-6]|uniref:YadA-like family protein n=1 Tax=Bartonella sp. DB5-6 TaxID=1094755 RepID=UPI00026E9CCC
KSYENVADAFTGVSSSFTSLDKKIENVVVNAAGDSLVKQDTAGLITIGGKVGGAKVSIANVDNTLRTLSGVNAGSISANSTDAINGSQLYSISNVVTSYFSDNAGYDEEGNWRAPTFTVKVFDQNGSETESNYKNVADALSGVSSSFTNLNKKIEHVTGDSFIKQNSAGLITIGGSKGGNRIDIANNINAPRILSGVKGGAFTKTSTEAVNGSQLYFMSQAFASYFGGGAGYDAEGKWSGPTFTVKAFDQDGNETEKHYTNVADAFAGVNNAFTTLNREIITIKDEIDIDHKEKERSSDDLITDGFPFMMRSLPMKKLSSAIGKKKRSVMTFSSEELSAKVNFANDKGETQTLLGITNGRIAKDSTEAVNGAQLYSISNQIATYFGGDAGYKNGEWTAPIFTVNAFDKNGNVIEQKYTNVADALSGVNSAFTSLNRQLVDIKNDPIFGMIISRSAVKRDQLGKVDQMASRELSNDDLEELQKGIDGNKNSIKDLNGRIGKNETDISEFRKKIEQNKEAIDVNKDAIAVNKDAIAVNKDAIDAHEKKLAQTVQYDYNENDEKTNTITLHGASESDPVVIANVGDGVISETSKQAINGGQLHQYTAQKMQEVLSDAKQYTDNRFNEAKSYTNMKFEALSYNIENVRKEARQAAAIGLAVSNLRYFDEPGSLSVSFGGGFWRGQSAFAIGAGYTSEDGKIRSNLSATSAGGQWGVGGGITLKLK